MSKKILIAILVSIVFLYGFSVGHYNIFPYDELANLKLMIVNEKSHTVQHVSQNMSEIYELIQINNENDLLQKRNELINYIWLDAGFPHEKLPTTITNDIHISDFDKLRNLKQIDSIMTTMEYGATSTSYLFLPEQSNNELIIYHQGHAEQSFNESIEIIQFFLDNKHPVLVFSMPGNGLNRPPIMNSSEFGNVHLNTHNHYKLIESNTFHPIKYFIEPISLSLNYLDEQFDFDSYTMIGLSGGGWTTVIYSALDPRISQSYSIAGSFPIWLREDPKNLGDYEQYLPDLYTIVNYEELYLLGSFGVDRKLILFYNKFDPCCFSGELYEKYPFAKIIQSKLSIMGDGNFDVYIDESNDKHTISDSTLSQIINLMNE